MIIDELRDAVAESLDAFASLDWRWQMAIIGGILTAIFMTVLAWKVMVPLFLLAIGVTLYLRRSRDDDSL